MRPFVSGETGVLGGALRPRAEDDGRELQVPGTGNRHPEPVAGVPLSPTVSPPFVLRRGTAASTWDE